MSIACYLDRTPYLLLLKNQRGLGEPAPLVDYQRFTPLRYVINQA